MGCTTFCSCNGQASCRRQAVAVVGGENVHDRPCCSVSAGPSAQRQYVMHASRCMCYCCRCYPSVLIPIAHAATGFQHDDTTTYVTLLNITHNSMAKTAWHAAMSCTGLQPQSHPSVHTGLCRRSCQAQQQPHLQIEHRSTAVNTQAMNRLVAKWLALQPALATSNKPY